MRENIYLQALEFIKELRRMDKNNDNTRLKNPKCKHKNNYYINVMMILTKSLHII